MRRTTGYAAALLATAVLGGATFGQSIPGGQNLDLAPPDPIIPLPLGHPRMEAVGGFYTAAEFVIFRQTNPIKRQRIAQRGLIDVDGAITGDLNGTVVNTDTDAPFIIRGPTVPGNPLGSFNDALYSDDLKQNQSFQPGFRITMGYKFDSGSALEFNYMYLNRVNYYANAGPLPTNHQVDPNLFDTFLFSPVYNFPLEFAGPTQDLIALGNPNSAYGIWNGADNMSIDFSQGYAEANLVGKVPWFQNDVCRIYGISGGRFAWFWERFRWRTFDAGADIFANAATLGIPTQILIGGIPVNLFTIAGNATNNVLVEPGNSPRNVANYTNIVSNRMYGKVVGVGIDRYLGYGCAISAEAQAALLVDIVKQRGKYVLGDKSIESKKSVNSVRLVPEVSANVQLHWYPCEGVQIRAGYDFAAFFNTIGAPEPVAFDFRGLNPEWKTIPVRFLDGFNAGVAFIF